MQERRRGQTEVLGNPHRRMRIKSPTKRPAVRQRTNNRFELSNYSRWPENEQNRSHEGSMKQTNVSAALQEGANKW